jgi:hypothetical protein
LQVIRDARYHEKRATHVATEWRKDYDQLKDLTQTLEGTQQQLQLAQEAKRSMEQDRSAWQKQQLEALQKEFHKELEKRWEELQRQAQMNTQNDDTETQMVEQMLQFENEVESLRSTKERLVGHLYLTTYKELRARFRKAKKPIWLRPSKETW